MHVLHCTAACLDAETENRGSSARDAAHAVPAAVEEGSISAAVEEQSASAADERRVQSPAFGSFMEQLLEAAAWPDEAVAPGDE